MSAASTTSSASRRPRLLKPSYCAAEIKAPQAPRFFASKELLLLDAKSPECNRLCSPIEQHVLTTHSLHDSGQLVRFRYALWPFASAWSIFPGLAKFIYNLFLCSVD